ncbi:hypothetical protein [Actinoplanes teichomyceticus]|uniref:Secreted protein n=1 Tax=Actinoplanes teichomyceticus TaxID=1867 RepID=A0A561WQA2_ACTTI|nr:hypothetical protein [Actinoplanes teichomyceticus]TWG26033.1 hypothetical protein FHX34_1011007 [Actinoplanes teichomyceticus]
MATLAGSLAGLAGAGGAMTVVLARRTRPCLPGGHALVPDRITDPLPVVLRLGLGGMTVRVVPGPHGELFLGPGAPQPGRTLRRLVLAPLFARARANAGRLWSDQREPFQLVIEFVGRIRDPESLLRAYRMLDQQLRDHAPLLTHSADGRLTPGVVSVTVTGIVDARELLAAQPIRYAFAECSFDDLGSSSVPRELAPVVSEPWAHRFGWDGCEPITAEERHQLHALVQAAHEDGRAVRISGLPDGSRRARAAIWSELYAAGVDAVADTDLAGLARHLRRLMAGPDGAGSPVRGVRHGVGRPVDHHESV